MPALRNLFKISYSKEELLIIKFLSRIPLFYNLSNQDLLKFIPYLFPLNFEKEEVIFYMGDPSQAIYFIKKGSVDLFTEKNSKKIYFKTISENECVGAETIYNDNIRIFTTLSKKENTLVYALPQTSLFKLLRKERIKKIILENYEKHYSRITQEAVLSASQ
ncbi:MAG: hypothetical protein A3H98_11220 [Bacteroidetes bacterium RIFCSPLOWO2_02_FULL_36_8]|nr:MAG: hypothetical protein A3H98_11220 [Bacteroidetes bacterium RIFCSPLOWO2_02_FULL_36_8]OFY70578.1 MAG: hypothetical protein A3G23_07510 [Bacteroidetes bacterium RIFCSPLOWO2_12_FULL_37_12]